jgi:hypothetical protein
MWLLGNAAFHSNITISRGKNGSVAEMPHRKIACWRAATQALKQRASPTVKHLSGFPGAVSIFVNRQHNPHSPTTKEDRGSAVFS